MTEFFTLFEMKHHRHVVLRTVLSSLILSLLASLTVKYLWQGLFAASTYPPVYQVQMVAFFLTIVISSPVLYSMFWMSLCVSRKNQELFQLANLDPLTSIYNRRALADRFAMLARKARRANAPGTLFVIDVDKFKDINDRHGHAIGDHVLVHLAHILRSFSSDERCFARLGGEEFALASFGENEREAINLAEKIRQKIETTTIELDNLSINYTVSIGYCFVNDKDTLNLALRNADIALYTAKRMGRNRTVCFGPDIASLIPEAGDLIQLDNNNSFSHARSSN